jgi:hypothetical protein
MVDCGKDSEDEVRQSKDRNANGDGIGNDIGDVKEEDDEAGEEKEHGNVEWQWYQPDCM